MIKPLLLILALSSLCHAEKLHISPNPKVYQQMDERTKKLRIPEVKFKNASMSEVLWHIQTAIAGDKKSHDGLQVTTYKGFSLLPAVKQARFTYSNKNVSVLDILDALKKQTGIGYGVQQGIVFWKIDLKLANAKKQPPFKIDKKFSNIILPRIDCENAHWESVIYRLISIATDNDPESSMATSGLPFYITPQLINDPKAKEIRFSYKARNISFLDAVEQFKKQTKIYYTIRPCIVLNSIVQPKLDERTKNIKIPKINLNNATVYDFIHIIQKAIDADTPERAGLQILFAKSLAVSPTFRKTKITYNKENISVQEALLALHAQTGIIYEMRQSIVLWKIDKANAQKREPLPKNLDQRFHNIIIPRSSTENATVSRLIARLIGILIDSDPNPIPGKKGIQFAVTSSLLKDPEFKKARITYEARGVTVLNMMAELKRQTGIHYEVRPCLVLYSIDANLIKKAPNK